MSIYLESAQIKSLAESRDMIFSIAKKVHKDFGIDILANDTLNSISIWEIVKEYDKEYNINFHRNQEDAKSGDILIENKCTTIRPNKRNQVGKGSWQFHAQGNLNYDRYIFSVRRKDTLELVKLYDISSKKAISVVQKCLAELKQKWIDKGKPNHDGISVPEKLLIEMTAIERYYIKNCEVIRI